MTRAASFLLSGLFLLGACHRPPRTDASGGLQVSAAGQAVFDSRVEKAATYRCVVSALRASGLNVVSSDPSTGRVHAFLRDELPAGDSRLSSRPAIGQGTAAGDYASPYLIDDVTAVVTIDPATGHPAVAVSAISGEGRTARGGYVDRQPTDRVVRTASAAQSCGPSPSLKSH